VNNFSSASKQSYPAVQVLIVAWRQTSSRRVISPYESQISQTCAQLRHRLCFDLGMNARIKPHTRGDVVKVRSLPQYPLPVGIGEAEEVVIREVKEGIRVVADREGRLHELPVVCVISAMEYRHKEEWVPPDRKS